MMAGFFFFRNISQPPLEREPEVKNMNPKVQIIIKEAILKCVKPPTPSLKVPLFGQILDAGFSTANFGAVWL